jgi:hypothetical protein
MRRAFYICYRFLDMMVSLISRLINAALLGGSTHQTTSARAHIEVTPGWRRIRRCINTLFFWQPDHCEWAWQQEVDAAIKTLQRAGISQTQLNNSLDTK